MIRKRGNKWATVHCHGANKGKTISTFDTYDEALSQHRAIQASKHGKRAYQKRAKGS